LFFSQTLGDDYCLIGRMRRPARCMAIGGGAIVPFAQGTGADAVSA
jgi:hypothetical protein